MIFGGVKLIYKYYQLRSFIKLEEGKDIEQTDESQMGEMVPESVVPFGIRAIESGIEVEGVWISKPNVPAPSVLKSLTPSTTTISPIPKQGAAKARSPSILPPDAPEPTFASSRRPTGPSVMNKKTPNAGQDSSQATDVVRIPKGLSQSESSTTPRSDPPNKDPSCLARPTYKPRQASHLRHGSGNIHEVLEEEEGAQGNGEAKNGKIHSSKRNDSRY